MSTKRVYKANLNGFYVAPNNHEGLGCPTNMGCPEFDNPDTISGGGNAFAGYSQNDGIKFPQTMGMDGLWDDIVSAGQKTLDKVIDKGQGQLATAISNQVGNVLGVNPPQPTITAEQIAQGYSLNAQGQLVQTTNSYVTQNDPNMKYYLMGGAGFLGVILLIAVLKK